MNPRLNETERALRTRAREAAAPLAQAAATIDADDALPRDLLAGLGQAGIYGASLRGRGSGRLGAALVCEELGAASAGAAAVAAAHLAALALAEAVEAEPAQHLLEALESGAKMATVVLDGAVSLLDDPAISIKAARDGDHLRLDGAAGAVTGAITADVLIVPATDDDGEVVVGVVEAGADGVSVGAAGRKLGLNGSGIADVSFDGAEAQRLDVGDAVAVLAAVQDLARIGHAALCVGVGRAALEVARDFVLASDAGLDRSQSVQWMLADMATDTEAARLLTWYAASRSSADELREAAAMARLVAADAAVGAGRKAVEIHGPTGNRSSSGVERLYRDAKALEVHHGAVEAQQRAVARQLLPDLFEKTSTR